MNVWDVVGVLGAVIFAGVLTPQVYLNAKLESAEGISLALILLWHAGSLLYLGYFVATYSSSELWQLLSMAAFAFVSIIVEAQVLLYRPETLKRMKGRCARFLYLALFIVIFSLISALLLVALVSLFEFLPATQYPLGVYAPAVLFALGFFPQFYQFLSHKSIEGYSFGLTALDVTGSVLNALVLLHNEGWNSVDAWVDVAPFIAIIFLHAILVAIAVSIKCLSPSKAVPTEPASNGMVATEPASNGMPMVSLTIAEPSQNEGMSDLETGFQS